MFWLMNFWNFLTSMVAFGGGSSLLSYLFDIYVQKLHIINTEQFLKISVITQIVPGPVAISFLSIVGYKVAGILGWFSSILSFGLVTIVGSFLFYTHAFKSKLIQNLSKFIIPVILCALFVVLIKMCDVPLKYSLYFPHLLKILIMMSTSIILMLFKKANWLIIFVNLILAIILTMINI